MTDRTGIVFDLQRNALHDGPGIRTCVFLKGCPLACLWCHNPESQDGRPQVGFFDERCVRCGACAAACPNGVHCITPGGHVLDRTLCVRCGRCVAACAYNALHLAGRTMTVGQVMDVVRRDVAYYKASGGGVTISGGEPMRQLEFTRALLAAAKGDGVHTCLDTCGHAPTAGYELVLAHVDRFLLDYKATDPIGESAATRNGQATGASAAVSRHRELTGVSNDLILANLDWLYAHGASITLRCPIIPGMNDTPDHWQAIADLSRKCPGLVGIEIMAYHDMGNHKYGRYNMSNPLPGQAPPDAAARQGWLQHLRDLGCSRVTLG